MTVKGCSNEIGGGENSIKFRFNLVLEWFKDKVWLKRLIREKRLQVYEIVTSKES